MVVQLVLVLQVGFYCSLHAKPNRQQTHTIRAMAIDESQTAKNLLDHKVKKTVLSEVFWEKLNGFLKLLKPVSEAIITMEGNAGKISEVMKVCKNVENIFEECISPSPVSKAAEKIVKEILQKRKVFCIWNIHYAANLLDQNYKGMHLTDEEIVSYPSFLLIISQVSYDSYHI